MPEAISLLRDAVPSGAKQSLADLVYIDLQARLSSFTMPPGERYSENELASSLAVSRTPLRLALRMLERDGLIENVGGHSCWRVRPLDLDYYEDLYDFRVDLEALAVQRIGKAATAPDLAALAAVWGTPPLSATDGEEVARLDELFHIALVDGSGNREMARTFRDLTGRIRTIRRLDFVDPARIAATYDEHAAISPRAGQGQVRQSRAPPRRAHRAIARGDPQHHAAPPLHRGRAHHGSGLMSGEGVGASLRRTEDDRFLRGRGEFVGDIRMAGMRDVAFVRSPLAHATLGAVRVPEVYRGRVFTAPDLAGVKPIVAVSGLVGFKVSEQPVLVDSKARHVGELIAMCLGDTRAEAEDVAAAVEIELVELPAVVDMLRARAPGSALLHQHWGDNVFLETVVDIGMEAALDAPIKVTREIATARQSMAPMEGRGTVAVWDKRREQLVLHTGSQMPHIVRNGLAECLGLEQAQVRIVSPDVGGGFGYKGILLAEDICLGWLAMRCGHPVRWIEDRREHLTAGANCREHHYRITAYADRDGTLRGIDCEATVDSGAYSSYPFSACLEAAQVASILPGPYDFPAYRCRTWSVATNKCPILPYRGVARTGVCTALELMLDLVAREAGLEPFEVRLKNLVRPEQMPFDNITKKHFDSGDYPEALRRAMELIDLPALRARQRRGEADGRLVGIGLAVYCEQGAHGTSVYAGWGIPMVPGHEQATARMTPDGGLEVRVGVHSHGQGMETTLAQVAHEILGIEVARIKVVHGDTEYTPYSTGTWGSRCAVMAGGAVASAAREVGRLAAAIGAHLLQVSPGEVEVSNGAVVGPRGSVTLAEVARTWYRRPQDLPADVDPRGLEATIGYKPERDSGTFSYAAHIATVAVDPEIGHVEILDYAIVEDGGTLINPLVVDGQIFGGLAQGIGTALYEEMRFDSAGQPLASTFADYLLPGPTEVPAPKLEHMETPAPYTAFGVKGIGEGGAIAPPAAIGNAVNDALKGLGAEVLQTPIAPRRVLEAITAARAASPREAEATA